MGLLWSSTTMSSASVAVSCQHTHAARECMALAPTDVHGEADVRGTQRRCVVGAIARHRHHILGEGTNACTIGQPWIT